MCVCKLPAREVATLELYVEGLPVDAIKATQLHGLRPLDLAEFGDASCLVFASGSVQQAADWLNEQTNVVPGKLVWFQEVKA